MRPWLRTNVNWFWLVSGAVIAVVAFGAVMPAVREAAGPQPLEMYESRPATAADEATLASLDEDLVIPGGEAPNLRVIHGPDGQVWAQTLGALEGACLTAVSDDAIDALTCTRGNWPIVITTPISEFTIDLELRRDAQELGATALLLIYADGKLEVWPVFPDDKSR